MGISSVGVGSGLDLDALLTDLRAAENTALAAINTKAKTAQNRLSAYGTVKGAIEMLNTAAAALGKAETFGALKTSVTGDGFTATSSSKAIAGQYSVQVNQLATSQTLTSAGLADRTTALASGTGAIDIQITVNGKTQTLTLNQADTSLDGLVKAINSDSKLGLSATLVNDGSGTPHRLLLTANSTGETASITKIETADAGLQAVIGFTKVARDPAFPDVDTNIGNLTETAAKNATLTINGIDVTSQSNTIENAIEGVTLTLSKKTAEAGALVVTRDDSVTTKAVTAFVTAFNALQTTIRALTSYNVDNNEGSALTGDSLARRVQTQVRDALNVAGGSGGIGSLSQLGITTNITDGTLTVDSTKLAAALKDNLAGVQGMFAGENGISAQMTKVANEFIKTGGSISTAQDGVTAMLKNLEDQYETTSDRIETKMSLYKKQFTALDTMVAQMNSLSSYLTTQLAALATNKKD
ncbi:flagellar hook-associated protein 2 [Pollutimonas nitritireducens]|uniref:Flagellar hook-associated protein 2 n=1 Tax=Pollutimonas nitritireducens TaxID=2045209 RepID=A0A2N4UB63_9BURK|nr:flagellar filament capping protein FliD [Pollutimonas nitritireducens]PLC52247.1 flagellar hook-associated protein 2 [Pollutimonas nitritireducens]